MKVHKEGVMLIMADLILAAIGSVVVLTIVFATFPNKPDSVSGVGTQLHISSESGVNIGASLIRTSGKNRIHTNDTEVVEPIYFRKPTKPSGSKISVMFDANADYAEETLFIYISDLKKVNYKENIVLSLWLRGPGVQRRSKMELPDSQRLLKIKFNDLKSIKGSSNDSGWLTFFCRQQFRNSNPDDCIGQKK